VPAANGHHPESTDDLGSLSTADLVTLFKQLHEAAQRNWQARIAVIAELVSRLPGSGRKRCKAVAELVGCSEAYTRQLYKVSQTFSPKQLQETRAPLSTVIAVSYAPQPERLLGQAEVLHLTGTQAKQAIHAERPALGYKPGRKPSQEVRACCPECGFEGLMRLLPAHGGNKGRELTLAGAVIRSLVLVPLQPSSRFSRTCSMAPAATPLDSR
jgi:hypothetical protein